MKKDYDSHHRPKFFKVGDLINLRLHREKAVGRAYATSAQGCVLACLENGQAGHGNSFTRDDCQFGSVNQILSNSTPAHIQWQRFYATIFEWACDDNSIYCITNETKKSNASNDGGI